MNNLIDVPIASVTALTPERAVLAMRAILRSECGYAKLSPTVLTISSRLTIADGGIDAEINVSPEHTIPADCIFQPGLTGFQIKSGTTFKPWTRSAIRTELLNGKGKLCSEVERLVQRGGRYALICTGHDLTPKQRNWPPSLRPEVCQAVLEAVEQQITTPPCTELAFQVLSVLTEDSAMPPEKLNHFFWHWQEYGNNGEHPEIAKRLRNIERRFTRRNLASRFQRYVIDVDWMEWDGDFRERHDKPRNRAKILVDVLARRIARRPKKLSQIQHLLSPAKNAPALWHFGEQLALNDAERALLPTLTRLTLETKHQVCMHGYLSAVQRSDSNLYLSTVRSLLTTENTAWLGATIALRSDYDDGLFVLCLDALEERWIVPTLLEVLRFGKAIESVPPDRTGRLFHQLHGYGSQNALALLIELLDSIPFNDSYPVNSDFVLGVVSRSIPGEESRDVMRVYHWKSVCSKLVKWDENCTLPLLDTLLTEMGRTYRLAYDSDVAPLANELVQADPIGAWTIVRRHLEETLPKWRGDLLHWLGGGLATFDEKDPEPRAVLMAHAVPGTLDEKQGGRLTQELLSRYGQLEGTRNGISATFRSGGWSGPTSAYLKRKRDKLRRWLAAGFDSQTMQWIEAEIEHLDRSIEREEIDEERSRFE